MKNLFKKILWSVCILVASFLQAAQAKDDIPKCPPGIDSAKEFCLYFSGFVTVYRDYTKGAVWPSMDNEVTDYKPVCPAGGSCAATNFDVTGYYEINGATTLIPRGTLRFFPLYTFSDGTSIYLAYGQEYPGGPQRTFGVSPVHARILGHQLERNCAGYGIIVSCGSNLTAGSSKTEAPVPMDANLDTATDWDNWRGINFVEQKRYTVTDPTPSRPFCTVKVAPDGKRVLSCTTIRSVVPEMVEYQVNRESAHRAGDPNKWKATLEEIEKLQTTAGYALCSARNPLDAQVIVCSVRKFTLATSSAVPAVDPLPAFPMPPVCAGSSVGGAGCYDPDTPSPVPTPPTR